MNIAFKIIVLFRYQEVFSFTIAELATSSKPSLKHWHKELVKALTTAGVDEKFCTKLMFQYCQSLEIGKLMADVLSHYIQTRRPSLLEFVISEYIPCPTAILRLLMRKVQQHHRGNLWLELHHSYLNFVPCDNVIEYLVGAK